MDKAEKKQLRLTALRVRKGVIESTYHAKSGHPGGSLSIAEILTYLHFKEMNIDPKDPQKADRDRFVLSKGHAAPALYATLAERGFFPVEDLKTLRKSDSYLQGHPNMNHVPGVDMSTGSLGQGISAACGMLSTDSSITDIAFSCGFNNLTTFNRCFKKYTKCSPSDYRASLRTEHFGETFF